MEGYLDDRAIQRYASGTADLPSATNVHVAQHEGLIVEYSRSPDSFGVNSWTKLVPVDNLTGYYLEFGNAGFPEEQARLTDTKGSDAFWPDGNDAPSGKDFKELFRFSDFTCKRYARAWEAGDMLKGNADWDIIEHTNRS